MLCFGLKGSGFQEQADVSFIVKDAAGAPAAGATVTFSLNQAPLETTVSESATAGTDGRVIAKVQAGKVLGVFTVRAVAKGGIETVSPAIGIRGVTPSNRGFSLQCDPKNLPAYASAAPPLDLNSTCIVKLVDRFSNPVGKATTVNFKVEAGRIGSDVKTTPFDPNAPNNDKEGTASIIFNTNGTFPARRVEAFAGEPSGADGPRRNGLVTVLAYVSGEEYFEDGNSNGTRDPEESFIDQGEPFVDENDNNEWDIGELYADVAPSNMKYDGPNSSWDRNTTIWTIAHILYTALPSKLVVASPNPVPAIPRETTVSVSLFAVDDRYNIVSVGSGATFAGKLTSSRGQVANTVLPGGETYGFSIARNTYDATAATTNIRCTPQTPRCIWQTRFAGFADGNAATFQLKGGAAAELGGPVTGILSYTTNLRGVGSNFDLPIVFN